MSQQSCFLPWSPMAPIKPALTCQCHLHELCQGKGWGNGIIGTWGSCPKPACMHTLPSLTRLLGATHANSKLLHGGGSMHPEGSTQSHKLLWAGLLWGRREANHGQIQGWACSRTGSVRFCQCRAVPTSTACTDGPHGSLLLDQCPSVRGLWRNVRCQVSSEAVKHLDCDNITYLKTGAGFGGCFFPMLCTAKVVRIWEML